MLSTNDERTVLTSINVAANARKRACQISVDIDDGQFVYLIGIDVLRSAKAEEVFVKRQKRADIRVEASGQNSHNARIKQVCRNNGCQCVGVVAFMGG